MQKVGGFERAAADGDNEATYAGRFQEWILQCWLNTEEHKIIDKLVIMK